MMEMVNRLRGSMEVEITGVYPERFINICAQNGVHFWNVDKVDDTQYRFHAARDSRKKLQAYAEAQDCKLLILRQQGLPTFTARFKKRYALLAGLVLWLIFVGAMGQFIWEIDVEGNETIPDELLLQALAELGVKEGCYAGAFEERDIKNLMLLHVDRLLWCALNVRGGRATLSVRERVEAVPVVPVDEPCNVIAGETGLLVRMDTLRGSPQVQNGQMVQKGQMLVSGVIDMQNGGSRFVHAMAYAKARIWRDTTAVMPQTQWEKQYTGREKKRLAVESLGNRKNLYIDDSPPFDNCDKIVSAQVLRVPLGVSFPIRLITETYREYEPVPVKMTETDAAGLLEQSLVETLERTGGEVSDLKMAFENRNGLLGVRMTAELFQDIAVTSYLPR